MADLQKIVDSDAASGQIAIAPVAHDIVEKSRKGWTDGGGELITLPPDEHAAMLKTLAGGAEAIVKTKPALEGPYQIMVAGAQHTK